jgi:aryl-alcohol dehydrogenase-like predicted oxidoreductase
VRYVGCSNFSGWHLMKSLALAGGQLRGKVTREHAAPTASRVGMLGTRPGLPREQFYDVIDEVERISTETDRTVAQVALNWVLRRPTVSTMIIGARNEAQLRDSLTAADFALSPEQVARLDKVSERMPAYPYWHQRTIYGERNPPPV